MTIDACTPKYLFNSCAILSAISAAYFSRLCLHLNTPVSERRSTGRVCGAEIKIGPPSINTYGTSGGVCLKMDTYSCILFFSTIFLWCLFTLSIEQILVGALDIFSFFKFKFKLEDKAALAALFLFSSAYATELLILFLCSGCELDLLITTVCLQFIDVFSESRLSLVLGMLRSVKGSCS